ncbi:phosphatase PAP2 family protein [Arthrobacter cheniae]|uniref:Phosphatase PAP2 family protein n=1 Tax=Arthrobacter cheniae TaxID=1258888 RepID=A0A3A5MIR3_9MICC|nr:phosphatase PAP2 family protein [Arthrobacter cheniae]RJT83114.1 phosphatase PAP2 family protein [Arthrobacter cheniae]
MESQHSSTTTARAARAPLVFVLAAAVCAAALGWTYWAFVQTTTGQFADESAWQEAGVAAPDTQLPFLRFLDTLPTISVVIAAAAILFVAVRRHRYGAAAIAVAVIVASNLTTQLLKNVVFDRPDRGVATLDFNSLPSGHTTLAASAAAAVFIIMTPRWRPFAAAVGGAYSVLAGVATYINLWHRPADVVAALLVVGIWTLIGGLIIMRTGNRWNDWQGFGTGWASSRGWLGLCWALGPGSLVLSAVLYFSVQAIGPAPVPGTATLPLFFWWGLAWIVGVGFTLSAAAGWLFADQARRTSARAVVP